MVTQDGNRSVGTVVGEDLRRDVVVSCKAQGSGEQVGPAELCSPSQGPTDCKLRATAEPTLPLMGQAQLCTLSQRA